jgi:hypothetical protein
MFHGKAQGRFAGRFHFFSKRRDITVVEAIENRQHFVGHESSNQSSGRQRTADQGNGATLRVVERRSLLSVR